MEKIKKYRFDDSYSKVYEYDRNQNAYIFIGTYFSFNIDKDSSEAEKIVRIEYELYNEE